MRRLTETVPFFGELSRLRVLLRPLNFVARPPIAAKNPSSGDLSKPVEAPPTPWGRHRAVSTLTLLPEVAFWERLPLAREKEKGPSRCRAPVQRREKNSSPRRERAEERFSLVPLVKKIKRPLADGDTRPRCLLRLPVPPQPTSSL